MENLKVCENCDKELDSEELVVINDHDSCEECQHEFFEKDDWEAYHYGCLRG